MKIIKYTKLKGNKYSVVIDDLTIKLYDDVIVKFELLRSKEIDKKTFNEIISYNDKMEAYYKALKYITKKLRTEKEVFLYLEKDYDKQVIDDTIIKLKECGYLNREYYLKCYLSDQISIHLVGPNKIKKDLLKLGYIEEEISLLINEIDDDIWFLKIEKIVRKKINSNKKLGNNKLREKLIFDLCNLGFYKWMVEDVISRSEFKDSSNILEREYNKIYNRLSKKYEGSNLNYQIKVRLIQKGFECYEVDSFLQKYFC